MRCPYLGGFSKDDVTLFCVHCSEEQKRKCSPRLSLVIGIAWVVLCLSLIAYLVTDEPFILTLVASVVLLIMGDAIARKFKH